MDAVDSAADASRRALDAERLRSSRVLARIRFIGISIAFVFNLVMPLLTPTAAQYHASVPLFAAYWLAAAAIHAAVRRSDRTARLVGLDVPLVDMPAAFALQLPMLGRRLDVTAAVLGGAPAAQPDHADRAGACACAMQAALASANVERLGRGAPALRMGIGFTPATPPSATSGRRTGANTPRSATA